MKEKLKVYELSLIVVLKQDIAFEKTTDIITKLLDDKVAKILIFFIIILFGLSVYGIIYFIFFLVKTII